MLQSLILITIQMPQHIFKFELSQPEIMQAEPPSLFTCVCTLSASVGVSGALLIVFLIEKMAF